MLACTHAEGGSTCDIGCQHGPTCKSSIAATGQRLVKCSTSYMHTLYQGVSVLPTGRIPTPDPESAANTKHSHNSSVQHTLGCKCNAVFVDLCMQSSPKPPAHTQIGQAAQQAAQEDHAVQCTVPDRKSLTGQHLQSDGGCCTQPLQKHPSGGLLLQLNQSINGRNAYNQWHYCLESRALLPSINGTIAFNCAGGARLARGSHR
jgi:hypothetical protein